MAASHQTPGVESSATASASMRPGVREHSKRPMFDTLQVANDLKKGGFSEPQAEALVSAFSAITRDLVTKVDLKAALKNYPTKIDLAALETRLTVRIAIISGIMSGIVVGAVGLIIKL